MERNISCFGACICLLLIGCVFLAGCTDRTSSPTVPATPAVVATTPAPTTPGQVTAAATPVTTAAATGLSTYKNAQYGISLNYPSTWDVQEPDSLALRDYGRSTINVVNFYSPGKDTYAVFSVDIDPYSATDLEYYYNHAVLALQSYYPHWTMTKHNPQMVVSDNKAYRIDYKVEHEDSIKYDYAYQVYTIADKSPYIFTYQVQNISPSDDTYNEYLDESQDMVKSTTLTPVSLTGKTR
jgi:hypothetical protein